jgi:serine/threonine protein kinase
MADSEFGLLIPLLHSLSDYTDNTSVAADPKCKSAVLSSGETHDRLLMGQRGRDGPVVLHMRKVFPDTAEDAMPLVHEIAIPLYLNLPSIVLLTGICVKNRRLVGFSEELVANGSLKAIIVSHRAGHHSRFDGTAKSKIAIGVALTMAEVHRLKVIHRGLTVGNVLLDEAYEPHLHDFLFGRPFSEGASGDDAVIYDPSLDVFAYGVLLYALFVDPFEFPVEPVFSVEDVELKVAAATALPQATVTDAFWTLITGCWSGKPDERLTFAQIRSLFERNEGLLFPGADPALVAAYRLRLANELKEASRPAPLDVIEGQLLKLLRWGPLE